MYVTPSQLLAVLASYRKRRTRAVKGELAEALMAIAGGVWDRYHFTASREDFVQDAVMHLLYGGPTEKADLAKPLFNYFTTCTINFGRKLRDADYRDRRRFVSYCEECVEAGRDIPEVRRHRRIAS
jgi:hypothetical protein